MNGAYEPALTAPMVRVGPLPTGGLRIVDRAPRRPAADLAAPWRLRSGVGWVCRYIPQCPAWKVGTKT